MSLRAVGEGHAGDGMTGVDVSALLRLPVRLRGIHLGRPVDVIFDRDRRRALGLEVRCGDDAHRFLPLAVADVREDAIELASSLVLLDASELGFYSRRGATFRSLRGSAVLRDGRALGALTDVRLGAAGMIEQLEVVTERGRVGVAYDEQVRFAPARPAAGAAS